ncbi:MULTISPECIES: LacI family DNA-binding transcriptional regulator [unclassified Pseudonocardia]|uniref:LacI family DNA-binding transcriptional regulator n=2 Tax=Pseudonocardia TaxID=1847 RepID=UPI001CF6D68A|nr:LacI family DNA-binding transcriptional regulator [Pseudonocardia sp. ICBG601]
MATMRDVARQAGVSVKTVSRVFNEDRHVLPETRRRVEEALAALNYTPNMLARTFRDGRSPVIGLAVPSISDPFFAAIADGVEQVAAQHDMSVLITSLGAEGAREEGIVESLLRRQLGALVMAPTATDQGYLSRWSSKLPLVFVDRPPRGIDADCFVEDDLGGARTATAHLIDRGHRRIAFVGNSEDISTTANRLHGYRAALEEAGLPFERDLVLLGATTAAGAGRAAAALAAADPAPTAVFSSDAQTTMVLVPALSGRRLAIAAFGDFPMAATLSPALTVVDQDPDALGRLAAQRVLHRLEGDDREPSSLVTLPVRLIERASCRPPHDLVELFPSTTPSGGDARS